MKGESKGFDPDLGRKFQQELTGSVIARARPLPNASQQPKREMPLGLDAQQQHDWENGMMDEEVRPSAPESQDETEEDAIRAEALRRLKARRLMQGRPDPSKA